MTKFDIRNYFEKIYSIEVADVHTRIQKGKSMVIINHSSYYNIIAIYEGLKTRVGHP